jgi:hypothetical protein
VRANRRGAPGRHRAPARRARRRSPPRRLEQRRDHVVGAWWSRRARRRRRRRRGAQVDAAASAARASRPGVRGRRSTRACRRRAGVDRCSPSACRPAASSAVQQVRARRAMRAQPVGAVVDGVHRGHHGQQHLRGADVAGRLLAADVLLAGLQRQAQAGLPWRPCETPMRRPGIRRLNSSRVAMNAACGPPKPIGTPKRWLLPTAMSAPSSPGGVSSVSASRSVATTTSTPARGRWRSARQSRRGSCRRCRVLEQHAEDGRPKASCGGRRRRR